MKSIPTVGSPNIFNRPYMVLPVERIEHEPVDDGRLTHTLIAQEHELILR
jgi:hypothetical protein